MLLPSKDNDPTIKKIYDINKNIDENSTPLVQEVILMMKLKLMFKDFEKLYGKPSDNFIAVLKEDVRSW